MLGANEVAPRLERRSARRAPSQDARDVAVRLLACGAYLVFMSQLGKVGPAQWVAAAIWAAIPLVRPAAAYWLNALFPFAVFAATYETLGLVRTAVASSGVGIFWPYWFDKLMFGVGHFGERLSLNEVFAIHHWAAVDLITGAAYMLYVHAVLAFAVFLGLVDRTPGGRRRLRAFGWAFFGANIAGIVTYLAFPVAPPWYVASHGFGPPDVNALPSPAALVRWDALTGIPYFRHFYAQATDVFGSMPSMHCAYPMLLLLYATELKRPRLVGSLVAFQLLMCFSAVYLQHHYVSDVLVGTAYATLAYIVERKVSGRIGATGRLQAAPLMATP
jgi:membrane-associated phospholipid phosphatase